MRIGIWAKGKYQFHIFLVVAGFAVAEQNGTIYAYGYYRHMDTFFNLLYDLIIIIIIIIVMSIRAQQRHQ